MEPEAQLRRLEAELAKQLAPISEAQPKSEYSPNYGGAFTASVGAALRMNEEEIKDD
jgi:hypothetical protein